MAQIVKHSAVYREEDEENQLSLMPITPPFSEEQRQALKNEGYQEGYVQGQEEARFIAHQQMNDLKEQLETLLHAIPQAIEQCRLDMNKDLVAMSLLIIQRYFVEQCIDAKLLEAQINQLLNQLNNQQSIELYLHPADIKALQQGLIQLKTSKQQITIKNDEALALGGFIIKTSHGVFDASIEKQIDKLKEHLICIKEGSLV
jgi:flagellar assembly protein FliH